MGTMHSYVHAYSARTTLISRHTLGPTLHKQSTHNGQPYLSTPYTPKHNKKTTTELSACHHITT